MRWRTRGKIQRFHKAFLGPIIAAGMGLAGSFLGNDDGDEGGGSGKSYTKLPEYKESKRARRGTWKSLRRWGKQPGYGAIQPDWADIWERARGKIGRYYHGSATSPGAIGKVRASAARRNVSGSPALEALIGRMGIEESQQLEDMSVEQAMQEAMMGEQGRRMWFGGMQNLSQMKPQFQGNPAQPQQQGDGMGSMIAGLGSDIGSAIGGWEKRKWYEKMIEKIMNQGSSGGGSLMNNMATDFAPGMM